MPLLVRSWNLFHGNAKPPERRAYLEGAVRLVTHGDPDVVCLQEVPGWALARLEEWSGMKAFGDVAARPSLGPIPWTRSLGRAATSLHHGLFRSAVAGQANAILVHRRLRALSRRSLTLNSRGFRRAQARWLSLPTITRLAWAKERRVCQAVRLALPDGRRLLVANLHATSFPRDRRLADAELLRAAVFAEALAVPTDICVLAGDFNVRAVGSRTLADLRRPEWRFSKPGPGIDHVLVRGAHAGPHVVWPPESRRIDGRIVSDHAPIEVTIE